MKKALAFALAFCGLALGLSPSSFAQDIASRTPVSVADENSNREQDKLNGPVRRVRVETAKITLKNGNWVEGPRQALGMATYDPTGRKIDSVAYPLESSNIPGNEHYLYDEKGNVVEMILRSTNGSILSKETYKYEFDQLGNWTKMSSLVAVFQNGKVSFEPIGITYRTISYYYNQAIETLNASSPKSKQVLTPSTSSALPNSSRSSTDSSRPSTSVAQVVTTIQPLPGAANAHAKKEAVAEPATVTTTKSDTATPNGSASISSGIRTTPDSAPATRVVQHVAEEELRNAAIELPEPEYSDAASLVRASGKVRVQILVDENGRVTNAQATSGHPILGAAAEAAARKARFSLTKISSGAPRVYGVISYDFILPNLASEAIPATSPMIDRNSTKPDDRKSEARRIAERAATVESEPKAAANYSEAARSFFNKGVAFQASGRYSEAAEAFNQAIRHDPNDANAYASLGMAYSAMEKHEDAIVVYKMALQTNRSALGAPAYYMWGHSNLALDKISDALSAYKQALHIMRAEAKDLERKETLRYPSLEQLHYGMGIAYLNSKRFSNSIKELKQVVKLNPKNAEAYYALAIAHLSTGNRREAEVQQKMLSSLDSALAQKISSALAIAGPPPGCRTIACR